ncbi:MAG: hypothetical protein KGZ79_07705 [Dethiobacter sp.]|nr:hypothetical protein [Dethiobacter sp.]
MFSDGFQGYCILVLAGSNKERFILIDNILDYLKGDKDISNSPRVLFGIFRTLPTAAIGKIVARLIRKGFLTALTQEQEPYVSITPVGMKLVFELEKIYLQIPGYKRYINGLLNERAIIKEQITVKPSVKQLSNNFTDTHRQDNIRVNFLDRNTRFKNLPLQRKPGRLKTFRELKENGVIKE